MIKSIVDFIKNLFTTKPEPEPVKETVAPKLNTEATWPFPTERPATVTAEEVAISESRVAQAVSDTKKASNTSPEKRKKRKPVKTAAPAPAPVVNAVPSKEDIKSNKKKNPPKKKK